VLSLAECIIFGGSGESVLVSCVSAFCCYSAVWCGERGRVKSMCYSFLLELGVLGVDFWYEFLVV
jgi:hypothetical protein